MSTLAHACVWHSWVAACMAQERSLSQSRVSTLYSRIGLAESCDSRTMSGPGRSRILNPGMRCSSTTLTTVWWSSLSNHRRLTTLRQFHSNDKKTIRAFTTKVPAHDWWRFKLDPLSTEDQSSKQRTLKSLCRAYGQDRFLWKCASGRISFPEHLPVPLQHSLPYSERGYVPSDEPSTPLVYSRNSQSK
jgi:hypothetical protein